MKLTGIFTGKETAVSQIMSVQQFKIAIGIENLDLYDLLKFIQKSKLVFKVRGRGVECS
jgi:hypothetical protein